MGNNKQTKKNYIITYKKSYKITAKKTYSTKKTEILINTAKLYLEEYNHRHTHMWKQNFRFFFASLVVMLLPNLADHYDLHIPDIFMKSDKLFPILGMMMSVLFIYISLSDAKRFRAISISYNNIVNNALPRPLQRKSIHDLPLKLINHSHIYTVPILMFLVLMILGTALLCTNSSNAEIPLNSAIFGLLIN